MHKNAYHGAQFPAIFAVCTFSIQISLGFCTSKSKIKFLVDRYWTFELSYYKVK